MASQTMRIPGVEPAVPAPAPRPRRSHLTLVRDVPEALAGEPPALLAAARAAQPDLLSRLLREREAETEATVEVEAGAAPVVEEPVPASRSIDVAGPVATLDDLLVGAWDGLMAGATVACPVCTGARAPRWTAAGGAPAGGRCGCGTALA
jgi:hypothetical protein